MNSRKRMPPKPPFAHFKKTVFKKAASVCDFVYQIGESESLRKPSKIILQNQIKSQDFKNKLKYVIDCLLNYRKLTGYGRGIAAVQVGIPERFAVIYTSESLITIINPKITNKSKKLFKYPEMCMSANPIIAPVVRPAWIEFDYYDEDGNIQHWKTKDDTDVGRMMNRVFQHEIDHMDGIINVDLVKNPRELILESDPNFYKNAKFEEV